MAAAAPQAAPAPPPEPINVPPMLERPMGTIPEALARPSGEVIHPRDQALIDRFKRSRQASQLAQDQARMDQFNRFQQAGMAAQGQSVVPEMLRRMPEVQVPRTAEGMVLEKFGGSMDAYNKWWNSLPQGMKPRSWDQALGMVSSPEALGVPKAAPKAAPKPAVQQPVAAAPKAEKAVKATPEVKNEVKANPDAFLHPLGDAPEGGVWEVSSPVGVRVHPTLKKKKLHKGTDFAAKVGTPLKAMQHGKVVRSWVARGGGGHSITIQYKNKAQVTYMHMNKKSPLKVGATVTPGQVVGAVGTAGTGPHLHAELRFPDPKTGKYPIMGTKNDVVHDLEKFLKASSDGTLATTDTRFYTTEDAEAKVMKRFNNKMNGKGSYNEWYASLPAGKKPGNYAQALKMLDKQAEEMMLAPM
tara:strand:+ start:273 stop:1511 length:1239 start_codon:yes stop_codon:yes gene_type:complete